MGIVLVRRGILSRRGKVRGAVQFGETGGAPAASVPLSSVGIRRPMDVRSSGVERAYGREAFRVAPYLHQGPSDRRVRRGVPLRSFKRAGGLQLYGVSVSGSTRPEGLPRSAIPFSVRASPMDASSMRTASREAPEARQPFGADRRLAWGGSRRTHF